MKFKYFLLLTIFAILLSIGCFSANSVLAQRSTVAVNYGGSLPATCAPGTKTTSLFFKTNDGLYYCSATNTWTRFVTTAGATGATGPAGKNTVAKTTVEPAGANCAAGGQKIEFGVDANTNGTLDAGEINPLLTGYVCNGANGTGGGGGGTLPSQIKVANDFAGADLGAKINAADAACGAGVGCDIWVFSTSATKTVANTMSTQVVLSSLHNLKFHPGVYFSEVPLTNGVIRMQDNTRIEGSGWSTIIYENVDTDVATSPAPGANYTIIAPYNAAFSCNNGTGTPALPPGTPNGNNNNTCRSSNMHISNIQLKGIRSNEFDGGVVGLINLGHCFGCSVTKVWFNEVSGYAVQAGSTQSEYPDSPEIAFVYNGITMYAANSARDVWITDNLMTNLQSQNLGIITCENCHIERNTFRGAGKKPFTISSVSNVSGQPITVTTTEANNLYGNSTAQSRVRLIGVTATGGATAISSETFYRVNKTSPTTFTLGADPGNAPVNGTGVGNYTVNTSSKTDYEGAFLVVIDVEPNGSLYERVINVHIKDNIIDMRECNGVFVTGIAYQVTATGIPNKGGIISGNTIIGNEFGTRQMSLGIEVSYGNTDGLIVANNYVDRAVNIGLDISGKRLLVTNNIVLNSGGGGNYAIRAYNLSNSSISNNITDNPLSASGGISEIGVNTNNTWSNNVAVKHIQSQRTIDGVLQTGDGAFSSKYFDNQWIGSSTTGFRESPASNNNIYKGNLTKPKLTSNADFGLEIIGTGSKVLSHHYTDGRSFMPNVITTSPYANPN